MFCNERILGNDEFVERMPAEADRRIMGQISINERILNARRLISQRCDKESVSLEALKGVESQRPTS
jgi:hypothetical protein